MPIEESEDEGESDARMDEDDKGDVKNENTNGSVTPWMMPREDTQKTRAHATNERVPY